MKVPNKGIKKSAPLIFELGLFKGKLVIQNSH